jgi:predicted dehydrogenase
VNRHHSSRRQFIKQAAAIIGGFGFPALVPGKVLGKGGSIAPSNRVTVGCIGIGWQGVGNLKAFLKDPNVQVVAVCDIDSDHLKEGKDLVDQKYSNTNCAAYRLPEELIARSDIDALVLSVPDHWHGIVSIAAVKAGKDVYGEKPLAHNWAEGQAICEAVNRYGVIWQTGSWQRSLNSFRLACELVRNGRIGQVKRVEVGQRWGNIDFAGTGDQQDVTTPPPTLDYDRWLGPAPYAPYCPARVHKNWRWNYDYGGGSLMDWVGHHVDIAHWGLDLDRTGPIEVEAQGEFPKEGSVWNTATKYQVTARYAKGITLIIDGGHADIRSGTKWIGEDGWIWIDRSGMEAEPRSLLRDKIRPDELHLPHSPGHQQQFIECVKTRQQTLTPCDVALRSATPGYLGQIAMLTERKIHWDPEKQEIRNDPEAQRMLFRPMRSPWHL